ncbi:Similar to ZNF862: Zinc finger protein 862 (Homo sapiens) [Cotesia congregata]|uniref:Similar to ZNF862: Zinc finger protein 862 (Homo sapiens) n=1 Tax=Cotesia congregata TaxID=51543 RepID=A0A8J2HAT8_COTCN|nr:Similar to ZNF862: Zinc finger protein 862 (Homo sapiens) [Cotesia congregata]
MFEISVANLMGFPLQIRKNMQHKFRNEWLQDIQCKDWIVRKETSPGEFVASCKFCMCVVSKNNKYSDLKNHIETKKHKKRQNICSPMRQKTLPVMKKSIEKTKVCEAYISLFIAEHTSIATVDHLGQMMKKAVNDSDTIKDIHLHRTKCSNIIKNTLSPHFQETLKNDIGTGKFSLLLDESTDISISKYLGIVIIYYSSALKKIITTFLKLAELSSCDANGIISALKNTLTEFNLNYKNILGLGTDNASVVTGVNEGVYQKLKREILGLVLIRCVCVCVSFNSTSYMKSCRRKYAKEFRLHNFSNFSQSPGRRGDYKTLYKLINDNHEPAKIVQACQTRWLSIHSAADRILNQWVELKTHFDINRHEYVAEMLFNMYSDEINLALFLFLCPFLNELQRVNKAFEAQNADPCKLFQDLTTLIGFFVSKVVLQRTYTDPLTVDVENYLDPNPYLGSGFELKIIELKEKKAITEQQEKELRERCIKCLIKLAHELRSRLPDNVQILQKPNLLACQNVLKLNETKANFLKNCFEVTAIL